MVRWYLVRRAQQKQAEKSRTSTYIRQRTYFNALESSSDVTSSNSVVHVARSNHVIRERFPLWVSEDASLTAGPKQPTPAAELPATNKSSAYHLLPLGHSIQLESLDVYIPTAVRYPDFPIKEAFNVFLNGWARDSPDLHFVCCLLHSLNEDARMRKPFEVKAVPYRLNPDSTSDSNIQNAEFYCSASTKEIHESGYFSYFKYLALSDSNCTNPSLEVIRIEYPERVSRALGVCVVMPPQAPNPEFLVEWLEWHRLQGVTQIYFYHDHPLDKGTRRVLEYYSTMEFIKVFNFPTPKQAARLHYGFSDVMATNDCKHRMSQFDYVLSLDIDEIVAPRDDTLDVYRVLKSASNLHPKAGVFQFHSLQVVLDWKPSRRSPLHLARHQVHHAYLNLGHDTMFARWAFQPDRVSLASKQKATPKDIYTEVSIPPSVLVLLRFRKCPIHLWAGCVRTETGVKDAILSRFETMLIVCMRQLPLEYILPYNLDYARVFDNVFIPGDSYYYGQRDNVTQLE